MLHIAPRAHGSGSTRWFKAVGSSAALLTRVPCTHLLLLLQCWGQLPDPFRTQQRSTCMLHGAKSRSRREALFFIPDMTWQKMIWPIDSFSSPLAHPCCGSQRCGQGAGRSCWKGRRLPGLLRGFQRRSPEGSARVVLLACFRGGPKAGELPPLITKFSAHIF